MKRKISIIGAGESGVGAALLAKKLGYDILVSDSGSIKDKYIKVLSHAEIEFEEGGHSISKLLNAEEVIKSPGIPDSATLVQQAKNAGIPVISEIEFAGRHTKAKKICITGSNGKTTTASLTRHIFQKAGLDVALAGNVGRSFAWELSEGDHDFFILEISSFQLDGMYDFKADCAILLNIVPDHLDRYGYDFQKYIDSKFRIIQNQKAGDPFIYCYDDEVIMKNIKQRKIESNQFSFSTETKPGMAGAYIEDNNMIINTEPNIVKMTLETLALQGKHNIHNSMAAGIAARIFDIRKDVIKESLSDFQNVAHRL